MGHNDMGHNFMGGKYIGRSYWYMGHNCMLMCGFRIIDSCTHTHVCIADGMSACLVHGC